MSALRSRAASGSLILGSIIFTVVLFEAFCRMVVDDGMHYHLEMWKYAVSLKERADDPAIGHRHVPGARAHLMGVDVQIGADGLRDGSLSAIETEILRILMLGDSVTLGWGISNSETVTARIEQSMPQVIGRPVRALNAGVGNYNTAMEVAWFEKHGAGFDPDAVVLNVFINDAEETPDYSGVSWWARVLYSRVILFGAVDTIARTVLGGPDWKTYYRDLYDDGAPGWANMKRAVNRLASLCRVNNIPLIIVDYPELRELNPYPFADVSEKIEALAKDNGAAYVSLLPAVQGQDPELLWVTRPDPHPNTYAAQLMARYLAPVLSEILLTQDLGVSSDVHNPGDISGNP